MLDGLEEVKRQVLQAAEKGEEVAEGGAAEESGEGRVVDIVDTDGDRLQFALSRDGARVSLAVNGRPTVASVRMVAADERTGLVNDGGGLFRIREGERADKLGALGALLAVVGGGVQPAQEQDRPSGSYGDAGEGAAAPAMLRRAWAELGVPLNGSGLPIVLQRRGGADVVMSPELCGAAGLEAEAVVADAGGEEAAVAAAVEEAVSKTTAVEADMEAAMVAEGGSEAVAATSSVVGDSEAAAPMVVELKEDGKSAVGWV
jgi:hypothetical protein